MCVPRQPLRCCKLATQWRCPPCAHRPLWKPVSELSALFAAASRTRSGYDVHFAVALAALMVLSSASPFAPTSDLGYFCLSAPRYARASVHAFCE